MPLPGVAHGGDMLVCRVRTLLVALPVTAVRETMRPLPITPLSPAPEWVVGVAVVRGEPVPVVDVGTVLGLTEPRGTTRFVAIRAGERSVALAVEEVLSVSSFPAESARALPPLLTGDGQRHVAALAARDARLMAVLETARLVPEDVWEALDRGPGES